MATTITQKPNLLSAVNTPMIYILKESASGTYNGFKFRYVLKVEVDGTEIAVIKIHKNQSNVGVFDISHILKTYVETQLVNQNNTAYSIHSLGIIETGKPFSQNRGQCAKVEVKAFTEVAADGILPVPKNSAVPLEPAPITIADAAKNEPLLNTKSPFSSPTVTFFSNKLPDV